MRRLLGLALLLALGGCYQSHLVTDDAAVSPDDLCARTGGRIGGSCCDYHCGDGCTLLCVRRVCICSSPTQVWDPTYGCVTSPECVTIHGG